MSAADRAFVPNGDSRRETAVLLVGTAQEHGISTRLIKPTGKGFYIPQSLADVLYDEPEAPPSTTKTPRKRASTKKASGNRAAKNTSTDKD